VVEQADGRLAFRKIAPVAPGHSILRTIEPLRRNIRILMYRFFAIGFAGFTGVVKFYEIPEKFSQRTAEKL